MQIVTIGGPKGGVAKTTTAVNLAHYFAQQHQRTLLIDMDSQGDVARLLGVPIPRSTLTLADVLLARAVLPDVVLPTGRPNLWLVPTDARLAGVQSDLEQREDGRHALREALMHPALLKQFDRIVVDTPPTAGVLNQAGFVAGDYIIVPVQATTAAAVNLPRMWTTLKKLHQYQAWHGKLAYVVPTMLRSGYSEDALVLQSLQTYLAEMQSDPLYKRLVAQPDSLLGCTIRASAAIGHAWTAQQTIFEYDPKSTVAEDYTQLGQAIENLIRSEQNANT